MVIFHSYVNVYQRVGFAELHKKHWTIEHSNRKAEVRVRTPDGTQSRVRMLRRLPNSEVVCIPGAGVCLGSTVQLLVRCLAGQLEILPDSWNLRNEKKWGTVNAETPQKDSHDHADRVLHQPFFPQLLQRKTMYFMANIQVFLTFSSFRGIENHVASKGNRGVAEENLMLGPGRWGNETPHLVFPFVLADHLFRDSKAALLRCEQQGFNRNFCPTRWLPAYREWFEIHWFSKDGNHFLMMSICFGRSIDVFWSFVWWWGCSIQWWLLKGLVCLSSWLVCLEPRLFLW